MSTLKDESNKLRDQILDIGERVKLLKKHPELGGKNEPTNEAFANLMLSYRHLEDARMRLGKVIQAMDGGTSIYDKTE